MGDTTDERELSHLQRRGGWAPCEAGDACELPIHLDMAPEAVTALPGVMLYMLLETMDPPQRVEAGIKQWQNEVGQLHRDYDLPAWIDTNTGFCGWYRHGKLHRAGDRPAAIEGDGSREWYHRGQLHRMGDKPAQIGANGHRAWYRLGKLWRENGLPHVVDADGEQRWYNTRVGLGRSGDLPARIYADGTKAWYQMGTRHRWGAPAVIRPDGRVEWWLRGHLVGPFKALGIEHDDVEQFWL